MDPVMVTEAAIKDKIQCARARWRHSRQYCVDELMWWERCVKPQLKRLLRQEEAERRENYRNTENHLYECLYDILRSYDPRRTSCPPYNDIKQSSYVYTLSGEIRPSWTERIRLI